jgi:hypothetical protein
MDVDYNDISGAHYFTYNLPNSLKRRVRSGLRTFIDDMEMEVVRHIKEKRPLRVHPDNIYHLKQANLAGHGMGWGFPTIVASMKRLFLSQIYQKTRETVAFQHIIPLWVVFPQPGNDINPFEHLDMQQWRGKVESEFLRWRRDPNYVSVMPIPIGHQFIGSDFSQMNIVPDLQHEERNILAGMGTPEEFIFGGTSWSATSISARMLENDFHNYTVQIEDLFNDFVIPHISAYLGIDPVEVKLAPIKMVDDIQQKNLRVSLAQQNRLSWSSVLEELGFDPETEFKKIKDEQEELMEIQTESQLEMEKGNFAVNMENTKHQMKMQAIMPYLQQEAGKEAMMDYQGADPAAIQAGMVDQSVWNRMFKMDEYGTSQNASEGSNWQYKAFDPAQVAKFWADQVNGMSDENEKSRIMGAVEKDMPSVHASMMEHMSPAAPAQGQNGSNGVDMRPQPEQAPPRRTNRTV